MSLNLYSDFSGSATDLVAVALACAPECQIAVDPDRTNDRLVRYYVTEGVMDRPERIGRDAAYGFRHLLQLLTARRMADAGMLLSAIARHNQGATTRALEDALCKPSPTAAELLVHQFSTQTPPGAAALQTPSAFASPRRSSATPALALPDVLDEVHQMKLALEQQVLELARQIDQLTQQQRELIRSVNELRAQLAPDGPASASGAAPPAT